MIICSDKYTGCPQKNTLSVFLVIAPLRKVLGAKVGNFRKFSISSVQFRLVVLGLDWIWDLGLTLSQTLLFPRAGFTETSFPELF